MTVMLAAPLVLASASPRRAEILRGAGIEFNVVAPDIDEAAASDVGPREMAEMLASEKAHAVAALRPDVAVLAADTVVALGGKPLGKPSGPSEAKKMLASLRGRQHAVITAVCITWKGQSLAGAVETAVRFSRFSQHEADAYVSSGAPLDKAGSYGIQDRPFSPVASYDGCYLNVVGLPLCLVGQLLGEAGLLVISVSSLPCPGHVVAGQEVKA